MISAIIAVSIVLFVFLIIGHKELAIQNAGRMATKPTPVSSTKTAAAPIQPVPTVASAPASLRERPPSVNNKRKASQTRLTHQQTVTPDATPPVYDGAFIPEPYPYENMNYGFTEISGDDMFMDPSMTGNDEDY